MSVKATIQVRRGTTSEWSSANPVLELGEPGYDLDLKILKVGDGTTAWEDLEGVSTGGGSLTIVQNRPPKPSDDEYEPGQFWAWTGDEASYLWAWDGSEWNFIGIKGDEPNLNGKLTFKTTDPSTTVMVPLKTNVDVEIDWGDGTTSTHTSNDPTHVYADPGTYNVVIEGTADVFGNTSTASLPLTWLGYVDGVEKFPEGINSTQALFRQVGGNFLVSSSSSLPNTVTNMSWMFYGASAFNSPLDFDTSSVTDMSIMFSQASSFNQPLDFDTSSVTDMSNMFSQASSFNQPLDWDTGSVTNMSWMFNSASAFNSPLDFDTSSVTNMSNMFYNASAFNQPLDWDTGSVTDMSNMFRQAYAFNRPLDWDTGSVTNMSNMFYIASAFDQDLSNWNFESVTDMANFLFFSGMSSENYGKLLVALAGQNVNNNVTLGATGIKYPPSAAAARATLVGKGWNITDGGQE